MSDSNEHVWTDDYNRLESVGPSVATTSDGITVLHLFFKLPGRADGAIANEPSPKQAALAALDRFTGESHQVVCAAMLGHKCDLGVIALGHDGWRLRMLQRDLVNAGLTLTASYVSVTEVSEYAAGLPKEMLTERLFPRLPPPNKPAMCFYPMSKRRDPGANWFTLPFDERKQLMYEHGTSGRKFRGRILQLVTGSTGLDDYEWGVTLFGNHIDDLKDVVYTMRYDTASAHYAEFGPFYTGLVDTPAKVLEAI